MSKLTEEQLLAMDEDSYMGDEQLSFFEEKLVEMRAELLERRNRSVEDLARHETFSDELDRAAAEQDRAVVARLREREGRLLASINKALERIKDRSFGYCDITGMPIGLPRLLARPTAATSVEAKEREERRRMNYRGRAA